MKIRVVLGICLIALTSGCVSYTLIPAGTVGVGALQVSPTENWNKAPKVHAPSLRKGSEMWTKDGRLLDRMVIISGVPDGESLIVSPRESAALPVFRADMLPNEIEELAESTFVKYFGEGNAAVSTENLRPHRFGEHRGIMFDLTAVVTESPVNKGTVGAFIVDEHLYMLFFIASTPHYYDKHIESAQELIKGARIGSL
jgi:hypothetical protein